MAALRDYIYKIPTWINNNNNENNTTGALPRGRIYAYIQEHHSENVLGLASGTSSLDEQEQGLRSMHLGNPDDVEPILRKRQYVLQV